MLIFLLLAANILSGSSQCLLISAQLLARGYWRLFTSAHLNALSCSSACPQLLICLNADTGECTRILVVDQQRQPHGLGRSINNSSVTWKKKWKVKGRLVEGALAVARMGWGGRRRIDGSEGGYQEVEAGEEEVRNRWQRNERWRKCIVIKVVNWREVLLMHCQNNAWLGILVHMPAKILASVIDGMQNNLFSSFVITKIDWKYVKNTNECHWRSNMNPGRYNSSIPISGMSYGAQAQDSVTSSSTTDARQLRASTASVVASYGIHEQIHVWPCTGNTRSALQQHTLWANTTDGFSNESAFSFRIKRKKKWFLTDYFQTNNSQKSKYTVI